MDTGKIDAIMRQIVMVSIFALLGLLLLLSALGVKVDERTITMDGLLPTIIAIFGIALLVFQIGQTNKQIQQYGDQAKQQNREILLKKFRKSIIACANNILYTNISEGYLLLDGSYISPLRCVACWRHEHNQKTNVHHFNMMFRIIEDSEDIVLVLSDLRDVSDVDRWDFRIFMPLFGNSYGNLLQAANLGYGIETIDQRSHECILYAVNSIQALDQNGMNNCQKQLGNVDLKSANDNYIDAKNVTLYPTRKWKP